MPEGAGAVKLRQGNKTNNFKGLSLRRRSATAKVTVVSF